LRVVSIERRHISHESRDSRAEQRCPSFPLEATSRGYLEERFCRFAGPRIKISRDASITLKLAKLSATLGEKISIYSNRGDNSQVTRHQARRSEILYREHKFCIYFHLISFAGQKCRFIAGRVSPAGGSDCFSQLYHAIFKN